MGLTAIVLGAAAGGGFPQWNCNCDVCRLAWAGDPRVRARTQASLAVSGDGKRWTLLNASPDLRAQLQATPALHPRGLRESPIQAVVLTGAEIDQTAGLLSLRERSAFTLMATAATLAAVADNPMFGVLAPDVVSRRAVTPGEKFPLGGGLHAELFMVPGKLPLYLEGDNPDTAEESAANVGVEITDGSKRLAYVPGAAAITPSLHARLSRADAILFDGTLTTDDEMIRTGTGAEGRPPDGPHADRRRGRHALRSVRCFRAEDFRAHQQHQPDPGRRLAGAPQGRGRRLGGRLRRHGDRAVTLMTPAELEAALRDIGARRYHRLHPFHKLLHGGQCTKGQVQAWALNRYYYQSMIPIKDASLIARCDDSAIRREWRSRLVDHDGEGADDGGIARWLRLTDGLGLDRDYVVSLRGLLPATRFAVDAYVRFVRDKTLLEAIASSLTELFSPQIISERMDGMLAGYPFVTRETLAYFDKRPPQAARDSDFALDYCKSNARTPEQQQQVLAALEFKCSVLWAMCDALQHAYVDPKEIPPGAFTPDG